MTPAIWASLIGLLSTIIGTIWGNSSGKVSGAKDGWTAKKEDSKEKGETIREVISDVVLKQMPKAEIVKAQHNGKIPDDVKERLFKETYELGKVIFAQRGITIPPEETVDWMVRAAVDIYKDVRKAKPAPSSYTTPESALKNDPADNKIGRKL